MKAKTFYVIKFESDHYDFRYWEHTVSVIATSLEIAERKAKKAVKREVGEKMEKGEFNFKGMPVKIFISKVWRSGTIYE